ncbi:DNA starvation/stationary phase protection protein Dps [Salipiger sp. P9]|uniref:DNA starvation/stationary phase protection protein Dps n=1 Tax=Salipiger pentaromativorans TaxID=2943193 RepID=UPI0021571EB5|nr:DNA starvation/stationary phase protection protein Dps [Salipiger pentaromativorans]MCR8546528.1 DNA starvation/stationary phase protection protein Dps [Salipiger pentaromativorans]
MPQNFVPFLKENARTEMIAVLNERLADTIDLGNAVKQAHWNLKGTGFIGVHELLDEVAGHLREGADLMAERVAMMGGLAQGTSQTVAEKSTLAAYPTEIVALQDHVEALVTRFNSYTVKLREGIAAAEEAGDEDTADLFTEVSRIAEKDAWFIGSNSAKAA